LLVDVHAHLDSEDFDRDREPVIVRAISAGVGVIINAGADLESSRRSVELAARPGIYAAVGIHPHDARHLHRWQADIEKMVGLPGVVAVGEIGLDYYRNLSEPRVQRDCFVHFIGLARRQGLPIIVHDRDAHRDIVDILRLEPAGQAGGVMHCFSGDWEVARACLDLGFYISIGGAVTFRGSSRAQHVAANVPLDRLLVETDCPYMAPDPYRGMRNEPGMVRVVAEKIAAIRSVPTNAVTEATWNNAFRLFGLNKGRTLV
jgi:TatD DNase family protein